MNTTEQKLLEDLANAVVEMDESRTASLSEQSLAMGIAPHVTIQSGLAIGMKIVGEKYEREEYFVPELMLCSDAMYVGLKILKTEMKRETLTSLGKIVIGVVEGDTHDIGKSLVQMMLEASGFEINDLGRDVPIDHFIKAALKDQAEMICLSTLMSTTMEGMADLIHKLETDGLRDQFKVVIGGGPVTQSYCRKIRADGYSPDAVKAVQLIKNLLKR